MLQIKNFHFWITKRSATTTGKKILQWTMTIVFHVKEPEESIHPSPHSSSYSFLVSSHPKVEKLTVVFTNPRQPLLYKSSKCSGIRASLGSKKRLMYTLLKTIGRKIAVSYRAGVLTRLTLFTECAIRHVQKHWGKMGGVDKCPC